MAADPCRLLFRKTSENRFHHTKQRNILTGIVQYPQKLQQLLYFHCRKISGFRSNIYRNALLLQHFLKFLIPAAVGSQQNYHIPVFRRPFSPACPVCHRKPFPQRLYFTGNGQRFRLFCTQFIIFIRFIHQYQFTDTSVIFRINRARIQCSPVVICNSAHLRTHHPPKHIVHGIHHLYTAAEVLCQIYPLACRSLMFICLILFQKQLRSCQSEFINALLYIPHHKSVKPSVLFT